MTDKNSQPRRVMGFGTFDKFHPGHESYLRQLTTLGDHTTVVIARDQNVARIKGKAPRDEEKVRLKNVREREIVNEVVLGHESDFHVVLREYKPDILGFGYDQQVDIDALQKEFPELLIHRLDPYEPERYKSSLMP